MKQAYLLLLLIAALAACNSGPSGKQAANTDSAYKEKLVIYQMMTRLFGNTNSTNKYYGSIGENGCGKFNDINDKALDSLKTLGITHVWYTGVIEHATMNDYSTQGIEADDPDVVKGRAGSPYAVKDYYDVDPDLAVDVKNRMGEFEALVKRTHAHKLKVLIDFIPNHVARKYRSDVKPAGVKNFGEFDDKSKAFFATNDFYYITGKNFIAPKGINAGGDEFKSVLKDGKFNESPAKATGNNVFVESPSIDDWYETVKLNYGVDYKNNEKKYFDPVPPVWLKMRDILMFWTKKNVDGFRCDMAEMVPVEFWNWVIPQVKEINPALIFIAEAYNPNVYAKYLNEGKFDFLYDKVGLYDTLKRLIKNEPNAYVQSITAAHDSVREFNDRMLSFLENHDEERIASKGFAGNALYAIPAMTISATISRGPVMIYFGQEVGEKAEGKEGFGGDDNRTTMFDYWGVSAHQQWMNGGKFDGGLLSDEQKNLRSFYCKLLTACNSCEALRDGEYYALPTDDKSKVFSFIRYTGNTIALVIANFSRTDYYDEEITLPLEQLSLAKKKIRSIKELLSGTQLEVNGNTIRVKVPPMGANLIELRIESWECLMH